MASFDHRFALTLVPAALLLGSLACAPAPAAPPAPGAAPGAPAAPAKEATPQYGGVAKHGTPDAPEHLNRWATVERASFITLDHVYDRIIDFDYRSKEDWRGDFPLRGALAESWTQPDPTTYLFKMRPGVQWHDGQPLTVEDVVWSLNFQRDPANKYRNASLLRAVDTVEKADAGTLKLTSKSPSPLILVNLARVDAVILPKHVFDKGGVEALAKAGIGTGAFKIKSFDRNVKTTYARNDTYWGRDDKGGKLPYLDGIEITHSMDRAAMQAAMAAQEMDGLQLGDLKEMQAFTAQVKGLKVEQYNTGLGYSLSFNLKRKPYDDLRVRRAIHLALDRHEVNKTVWEDTGLLATPVVHPLRAQQGWGLPYEEVMKLPGYRKDKTEDLAQARRLLAEAGHPNGFKTDLLYIRTWGGAPSAEFLPIPLKRIGVEMELRGMDGASFDKDWKAGNWDTSYRLIADVDPFRRLHEYWHSKGAGNFNGLSNPELDRLIDDFQVAVDPKRQKEIIGQVQKIEMDNVYFAPILEPGLFNLFQPWVNDWYNTYSTQIDLNYAAPWVWFDLGKMPGKRKA